ncbi:MAG: hypothetical protein U9R06_02690 [Patescibacteria group bacterium]|nr:hypothetical protein [Patescibacteria group bacterium]
MTLKRYLIFMSLATLICWAAWNYIAWAINPELTNWIGFLLFYFSLFAALTGTAALVGFIIRFIGLKQKLAFRSVKEAFRQSFLFSALIVISLLLLSRDLFTWLNIFLLIIGLSILEFFLISYKNPHNS